MYEDYFIPYPTIETPDLRLRMVRRSDAKQLYELCSRPETSKYSMWSPHSSLGVTKRFISYQLTALRRHCCTFFVIEQKSTGNVIGTCSYVSFDDSYKVAEIGYSILRELWGRGYATQAAGALTGYAFERIGAQRVFARVIPENTASAAVLKKLGFGFEGRHKKEYYYNGISADIDIYAMTDDEYAKGDENGTEADSQLQRESQHA